ncbi:YdeI family protein [soil metagenome]
MPTTEPRIDAYIEKSAEFAKPVLQHIRKLVHKACPGIEENIKWSMPFFDYKGASVCNMASFKQHCSFGFWKAALMKDPEGIFNKEGKNAMGQFDRIISLKDLPADKILIAYIKEAAMLNEAGIKMPAKPKAAVKEIPVPEELTAALKKNKKAQAVFEKFPPSHKKEYIQWISEAKTEPTRDKRIAAAIEWIAEGKGRNWKYEKK